MRSLASRVLAIVLVLSAATPALVQADSKTEIRGIVANSTHPGLAVGDRVEAEWKAALGKKCELQNKSTRQKARGTTVTGTDTVPPSNGLACLVNKSNLTGQPVNSRFTVEVQFSDEQGTTNCGGTGPDQACIDADGNPGAVGVTPGNAEINLTSVEAGSGDDDDDD